MAPAQSPAASDGSRLNRWFVLALVVLFVCLGILSSSASTSSFLAGLTIQELREDGRDEVTSANASTASPTTGLTVCPIAKGVEDPGDCPMNETLVKVVTPGPCAAYWLSDHPRGCHLFNMIDFDLDKHKPGTVGPPNPSALTWVGIIMGLYEGKVVYLRRDQPREGRAGLIAHYAFVYERIKNMIIKAAEAGLPDLEFEFTVDDEGVVWASENPAEVEAKDQCQGRSMPFGIVTSPTFCNAVLPPGIHPGPPDFESHVKEPYCDKIPKFFWRGGAWQTERCAKSWTDSGRYRFVETSMQHPDLVNASFTQGRQDGTWGPPFSDVFQLGNWTPFEENYKYTFVCTSAPGCSYITTLVQHLSSSSVVAKAAKGLDFGSQALYAGLQQGVHLLHIYREWAAEGNEAVEDQMRRMQRAWRYLAGMSENAQTYNAWAHSENVTTCYFLKLMMGYLTKLYYALPKGTLARAIPRFDSGRDTEPELGGKAKLIQYYGEEWHLELVDVDLPENRDALLQRSLESCRAVEDSQPKPKLFNNATCTWE